MNTAAFEQTAIALGASAAATVPVCAITFDASLRTACKQNLCGHYGKNWMCPPHVGDINLLIERARGYTHGLVFQSIGTYEDSFDFEGMQAAGHAHNVLTRRIGKAILPQLSAPGLLLGAGGCSVCPECAIRENLPCRLPDEAFASLESYGIFVAQLAKLGGMAYMNGVNTVTFFGMLLFNAPQEPAQ